MPSFQVSSSADGCHHDLLITLYLFVSKDVADDVIGNVNTPNGRRRLRAYSQRQAKKLETQFNEFWNPDAADGEYFLYLIPPCCSFHISLDVMLPPAQWARMKFSDLEPLLPEGTGVVMLDDISAGGENAKAEIGGKWMIIDKAGDKWTFNHELGHLLGLQDDYQTEFNDDPAKPNYVSPQHEQAHIGHLMGLKDQRNPWKRQLTEHEQEAIVAFTGMTCDEDECCKDKEKEKEAKSEEGTFYENGEGDTQHASYADEGLILKSTPTFSPPHTFSALTHDWLEELVGTEYAKLLRQGKSKPVKA